MTYLVRTPKNSLLREASSLIFSLLQMQLLLLQQPTTSPTLTFHTCLAEPSSFAAAAVAFAAFVAFEVVLVDTFD